MLAESTHNEAFSTYFQKTTKERELLNVTFMEVPLIVIELCLTSRKELATLYFGTFGIKVDNCDAIICLCIKLPVCEIH